jgi:drug/metabolite transporter (DMT)-like permease
LVSGVSVFLNSYGVKAAGDAGVYTTAKNLVAAAVLVAVAGALRGSGEALTRPRAGQWWGLAAIAVIGGSVPFLLFFEGLARASSVHAAFIHRTLVVWVALLAPALLRERLTVGHVVAIALVLWGQAVLGGGVAGIAVGRGEMLILAATMLWAVEVVVAKRLLGALTPVTVGVARMALGVVILLAWTVATGHGAALLALGADGWGWALVTGVLLAAYVATWYAALARAGAVDVTAVLVLGAAITAALDAAVKGTMPAPATLAAGIALVALGAAIVAVRAARRPAAAPAG